MDWPTAIVASVEAFSTALGFIGVAFAIAWLVRGISGK